MSPPEDALAKFGAELRDADKALAEVGIFPGDPLRPLADRIRELAARVPEATPEAKTDLWDVSLVVTVRAYSPEDAEHLGAMYQDRVAGIAPAWPVTLGGVKPSERDAI